MVSGKYLFENGFLFKPQDVDLDTSVYASGICACGRRILFSRFFVNADSARLAIAEDCKNCSRCRQIAVEEGGKWVGQ